MSSVSGACRVSRIKGLEGTQGVTVLGVESVTGTIVIGSVSGRPMGEGPGEDGAIDLMDFAVDGDC